MPAYLGAIAGDIADSLGRDGAPRPVLVEAEPLRLPADAAVLLGLIANELATNAIKHAYAAGEEGPVTIRLRAGAGRVRLEVADGGRGLPPGYDPAAGGGLGMRLVLALTRQLRGTLTAGDAAPGALFAVELPFPGGPPQASTNATA
jgi:two-component sensor histidine kinase